MFTLFHCFIFATTKEIRRAECAKQSARFFYYSELKDMNALKVLSDTNNFKGCVAPKAVTTIKRGTDRLQIFEGFMDFLSWQTLNPSSTCDAIVFNSLALLPRIRDQIVGYKEVESFLDNDDAGLKSFAVLRQMFLQVVDGSARYREHKDLNEWLVAQSKIKEKQVLLPTTKRGIRR